MTDQNNLTRGYSSDVSEEDPLAELARIVAGQEPLTRKPAVNTFAQQYSRAAAPVAPSEPAAPAVPSAPVLVEAPSFDLEDALLAELGFGEAKPGAAPVEAIVIETPVIEMAPEPVAADEPEVGVALSLEDQLMAELSFDGSFEPVAKVQAPEPHKVEAAPMPHEHEDTAEPQEMEPELPPVAEQPMPHEEIAVLEEMELKHQPVAEQPARREDEADFDEFAAILQEEHPAAPVHADETGFEQAFEDALAAAHPGGRPEEADDRNALDSMDFGSAFEAELRELEYTPAPVPPVAVRKPLTSLATPVAPRREPPSERALEDHFAAAFAEELDLGVSKALEQGRRPVAPATPAPSRVAAQQQAGFQDVPESWEQEYPLDPVHDAGEGDPGDPRLVPPPAGLSRGVKLGAAALAIAAIVGGGVLAASLMGGDGPVASSEPVVVKADAGPVKVKPENPGGVEIQNQDQDVYKKVAGASADGGSQEKLVVASEEPVAISNVTEEPPAPAAVAPADATQETTAAAAGEIQPAGDGKADARLAPAAEEVSAAPAALAPRRVKTVLIKPDGTVVPAPAEETMASVETANPVEAASANVAALAESGASAASQAVDAAVKPAADAAASAGEAVSSAVTGATESAPAQVASAEPSAAPVASGEWAVQLASQRSAEDAQATFQNLKQKFPSVLDGKPLAVQRAEVQGKGVFYRVRVPTQTKEEAAALCEQLKAAGGSCFITR